MTLLKIQPEDCTPLGRVILRHMQTNGTSLRELSKAAGLTHPTLRLCCLGQGHPTENTLRKLSTVLKIQPIELYFLAHGEYIKTLDPKPDKRFRPILEVIDRITAKAQG